MKKIRGGKNKLQGLEQAESCVCFNLRATSRAVTQFYNAKLRPSGLLATQFSLMAALAAQQEGIPVSELAGALSMDRTTLARNLRPLENSGMIQIVPDYHDRRIQLISLTPEGVDKLAVALPLWRGAQQHILKQFGSDRWQGLLGDLAGITMSVQV